MNILVKLLFTLWLAFGLPWPTIASALSLNSTLFGYDGQDEAKMAYDDVSFSAFDYDSAPVSVTDVTGNRIGRTSVVSAGLDELLAAENAAKSLALVPKATRSLGQWGEARLTEVLGEHAVKPPKPFFTSLGLRYLDRLANRIAHESKAGLNVGLNSRIERQILKDAELIQAGRIQGAHWHFFQGAQSDVLDFLTEHGISYTVY